MVMEAFRNKEVEQRQERLRTWKKITLDTKKGPIYQPNFEMPFVFKKPTILSAGSLQRDSHLGPQM